MPFYTWASVIVNGRVVATDYAPDAGWLVATPGARPGGTFLLGDPFPHLSMTVPEGWTDESSILAARVDRVTCEGERSDASHRAITPLVRVIDDPRGVCADAIEPPLGSSFDDLVTLSRVVCRIDRDYGETQT